MISDFIFVLQWWGVLLVIGLAFFPLTRLLFINSKDSFYIFSKVIGIGILSYGALLFGTLHILPFTTLSLFILLIASIIGNYVIWKTFLHKPKLKISKIIIFEELLFLIALTFWAYVRGHEPSIHGLEKFMDFGFVNSILRTTYFPPKDIWFTPFSINYYFFGHLTTAVLTKISMIPSNISYNLMLATLFAFTAIGGFSLLYNFLSEHKTKIAILGGILGGALLSLSGNLHTLYTFFSTYKGENPVPPWTLQFLPSSFPNGYWYPNATRFIPFTIHEFPLYSFVVSDLHGHVTDIPFVLTTLALLYTILKNKKIKKAQIVFLSLLLAIMYMTNVWDGIIYLLLSLLIISIIHSPTLLFHLRKKRVANIKSYLETFIFEGGITILLYALFTLPFSIFFKPFVSGIGVLCAPSFLTRMQKIGPFLFETNHCQHSPLYQLVILYGFFYIFAFFFFIMIARTIKKKLGKRFPASAQHIVLPSKVANLFVFLLITIATLLIFIPEVLYAKDIYPQHYRANTMFKLVYQSFILLSLTSAYIIVYFTAILKSRIWKKAFISFSFVLLVLVFIYPYYAISSYYGNLKDYSSLDGTTYLKNQYPGDLEAIHFINSRIPGQPVILEAQGDSYTDYARISANTGLPTVLGWTVHEWLWRGTYDVPAPRIEEIKTMYEGQLSTALPLLKKYHVSYVVIGPLEYEKYPKLNSNLYDKVGKTIFTSKDAKTRVVKLND